MLLAWFIIFCGEFGIFRILSHTHEFQLHRMFWERRCVKLKLYTVCALIFASTWSLSLHMWKKQGMVDSFRTLIGDKRFMVWCWTTWGSFQVLRLLVQWHTHQQYGWITIPHVMMGVVCVCVFFICIHSVWSDISSCTILDEVYKKMGCKTLSLRKRWRGDFRFVERQLLSPKELPNYLLSFHHSSAELVGIWSQRSVIYPSSN